MDAVAFTTIGAQAHGQYEAFFRLVIPVSYLDSLDRVKVCYVGYRVCQASVLMVVSRFF